MSNTQHVDYFFENHRVFLVETTLFRIPIKQLVAESQYFATLLADGNQDTNPEKGVEGGSSEYPIPVSDETTDSFALMLRWIYNRASTADLTKNEWVTCLRIAHVFGIPKLSLDAQREAPTLCFDYQLALSWATDAVMEICYSWNPFPLLDAADPTSHRLSIGINEPLQSPIGGPFCLVWRLSILEAVEPACCWPGSWDGKCPQECGDSTTLKMIHPVDQKESELSAILARFDPSYRVQVEDEAPPATE
ncbi:hypothetical protein DL96DRAFT_1649253 [Flagelloscypha sp. PMI_526]|nr:hypothetical protein DL96DRAFT_1649253 [Flagelloscypha sp. PMI_526]